MGRVVYWYSGDVKKLLLKEPSRLKAWAAMREGGPVEVLTLGLVFNLQCNTIPDVDGEHYWAVIVDGPLLARHFIYDGRAMSAEEAASNLFETFLEVCEQLEWAIK